VEQTFGNTLKTFRLEQHVGQVELASAIGFSKGIISLWETNKRQPTLYALIALANYFHVSLDTLCGRNN
jgi:transcriptional regulator with XRE-family HTH domain